MNIWFLTEERPKKNIIKRILQKFCEDHNKKGTFKDLRIQPIIKNNIFTFTYEIEGISIEGINNFYIKLVRGRRSFVDYLVYFMSNEPKPSDYPKYVVEVTKTQDIESRNVTVYQRGTKFVYVNHFYPNCRKVMLYEGHKTIHKKPSSTYIFGMRLMRTIGVEILGRKLDENISPFKNVDELINCKNKMKLPPRSNVPIRICKDRNRIFISARLDKPQYEHKISHDPNIGCISLISANLRTLGWRGDIIITKHNIHQNKVRRCNKFLLIADKLNIKLEGIRLPECKLPSQYWSYENSSEKIVTIFLAILFLEDPMIEIIFENHAGCERGYFEKPNREKIQLPKDIKLPDMIVLNKREGEILIIEGEKYNNIEKGVHQLDEFEQLESNWVRKYYSNYNIIRTLVVFGGDEESLPDPNVSFMINKKGKIIISSEAPVTIKETIYKIMNSY